MSTQGIPWATNRHVLITGASGGFGAEIARRLVGRVARLTLVSRNRGDRLTALAAELTGVHGGRTAVSAHPLDVRDVAAAEQLITQLYAEGKHVDAFVCAAGGCRHLRPYGDLSSAELDEILDINLRAPAQWCRLLLPRMAEGSQPAQSKRAHVVLIGSRSGERALPRLTAYAVAKAGLHQLAAAGRADYGNFGVVFTVVAPGSVETRFTEEWCGSDIAAHNEESMHVAEAAEPIVLAMNAAYAVNHVSYQSVAQWRNEPGLEEG